MGILLKLVLSIAVITFLPVLSSAEDILLSSVKADYVLVEKSLRRMTLYTGGRELKSYRIALGREPLGHKVKRGDNRTPEGIYIIDERNPESQYHLSLHISYPDRIDLMKAESLGFDPGGSIMIHGAGDRHAWKGKFHAAVDWTEGCIAVTNDEIEEIWKLVPDGTMIKIVP